MAGYLGAIPVPQATQNRESFTALANQTSFATAGYTVGFVDAFLNGVRLNTADITASNGSDIVLASGAAVNDILDVISYATFEINAQTFTGTTTMTDVVATSLDISGNIDIDGITNLDVVDIDGAVNMATTLLVTGNVDFNGDLDVDGTTNLDVVDIDGAVNIATTALVTGVLTTTAATVSNGGGQFNGAINVGVDDTGYDVKFFGATASAFMQWDASTDDLLLGGASRLGIGTASPSTGISVVTGSANGIELGQDSDSSTDSARLFFSTSNGSNAIHSSNGIMRFFTGSTAGSSTGTERFRLSAAGDVLIGTASVIDAASGTQDGFSFSAGDRADFSRNQNPVLDLRRRGNDGSILDFYKDTTNVGSIATSGSRLHIGSTEGDDCFIGFGNSIVRPTNAAGSSRDNNTDLGFNGMRFKDLYLSGGVLLGGVGAANKLDDYEEGTWVPVVAGSSTSGSVSFSARTGFYTKIGRFVHIDCVLDYTISGEAGTLTISGMPFQTAAEAVGSFQCNNMELAYQSNVGQYTPRVADNATAFTFRGTTTNGGDFAHMVAQSMSFLRVAITYQTD